MTTVVPTAKYVVRRRPVLVAVVAAAVAALVLTLTLTGGSVGGGGSHTGTQVTTGGSLRNPANPCHIVGHGFC